MMKKLFALLSLVLIGLACGTAPVPRQIQSAFPIDRPFEQAWQAMIETFAELNLPIMNMEKASGLITTDWISFRGQKNETGYCDCGSLNAMLEYEQDRLGRFNVYVKKITNDSCEIKINSVFELRHTVYQNPNTFTKQCVSTGKLETKMFQLISEKAK